MKYRIFGMKLMGVAGGFSILLFILFALFDGKDGIIFLSEDYILITLFVCFFACLLIGWRIGASFDEQCIELEAILRKLGFYKPSMTSLNNYSVFAINRKNKIKINEYPDRWEQYTYHLDLAQQADKEKYGRSVK